MTERCLHDASRIKGLLNTSVDPCENFYEFCCGNFKPLPHENPAMFGIDARLEDTTLEKVRRLIEAYKVDPSDVGPKQYEESAERKMVDFYKSCTQSGPSEESQMTGLRELMRNIGGYGKNLPVDRIGKDFHCS